MSDPYEIVTQNTTVITVKKSLVSMKTSKQFKGIKKTYIVIIVYLI